MFSSQGFTLISVNKYQNNSHKIIKGTHKNFLPKHIFDGPTTFSNHIKTSPKKFLIQTYFGLIPHTS